MLEELFNKIEEKANKEYDGHYTIFKFSSCYQGAFATPILDHHELMVIFEVLPRFKNLEDLLNHLLVSDDTFYMYDEEMEAEWYKENVEYSNRKKRTKPYFAS